MQLYQNPTILSESSASVKLLLWAQDYCPIPKWQTQNTVRVIRVIAKPTAWKTTTVLVTRMWPITVQRLWRKCSIKVQPQWKEYKYHLQCRCRCPWGSALPVWLPSLTVSLSKIIYKHSVQHLHMHIHMCLWCPHLKSVNTHIRKIQLYTVSKAEEHCFY